MKNPVQKRIDRRTLLILIKCLLLAINSFCQGNRDITTIGAPVPADNNIFVAEIHGIAELPQFKAALVKQAVDQYRISNMVMEIGKSRAYLINSYFRSNDSTILLFCSPDSRKEVQRLKQVYLQHPFTVYGIDFERLEFVSVLHTIFGSSKSEQLRETELFKYINSLQDSVVCRIDKGIGGSRDRKEIYGKARQLFQVEKDRLKLLLGNDYNTAADIFENPVMESHMKKRDETMLANLLKLKASGNFRFLCIIGGAHINLGDKKTLFNRYIESTADKCSLIYMVCKNCYITSYLSSNFYAPIISVESAKKESILSSVYDKYYVSDNYSLIEQKEIKEFTEYNSIPTYYALFKNQPQH